MHSDDPIRERACSPHFNEVLEISLKRRQVLKAGLGTAALAFLGVPSAFKPTDAYAAGPAFPSLGFAPVGGPGTVGDTVRVSSTYEVTSLIAWGDPIKPGFAPFSGTASENAAHQANSFGAHCDGMHFFPFPVRGSGGAGVSSDRGIICVNNEYADNNKVNADGFANWNDPVIGPSKVKKMLAAHGVSVLEIKKDATGWFAPVITSPFNRRITGETPCDISGPAAGHPLMKTPADPTGRLVLGTLNNCAHGYTPWGTYLTCEENFNGYFGSASSYTAPAGSLEADYGLSQAGFGYRWHENEPRFDINANKIDGASADPTLNRNNEPNRFGWTVEIDPFTPAKKPVKRTALGRIKHEGAWWRLAGDGRVVLYMGDDQAQEYIYKFVTKNKYNPLNRTANLNLLDEGTLYVAKFLPGAASGDNMGTGEWLELSMSNAAVNTAFGGDLGAMLINTRRAADVAGATPMDRPEWGAINPLNGRVYFTLTNNSSRQSTTPGLPTYIDDANPRGPNIYGHIIRWTESGGDAAALAFDWDLFALAGDPTPGKWAAGSPSQGNVSGDFYGSPDGLWFDKDGRLWIQTDISSSALGLTNYSNMPNNMMLCADPATKETRRFLTGPYGCEVTGVVTTPDQQIMFVGIQHPGEAATDAGDPNAPEAISKFPNSQGYGPSGRPRSTVMQIRRIGGGVVGT